MQGEEEVRLSLDISRSSPSELSRRASNSVGDKELTEAGTLTYPDTNGVYHNIKLVGVQKLKPDGTKALKAYISSISMNNGGVLLESDYSRIYNQLTILLKQ